MATLNKVQLIGNVGNIENKQAGKHKVTSISLCTNKNENALWHNVTLWNKLSELAEKYVNKGDLIYIEGELNYNTYEKDSEKRKSVEIVAASIQFLSSKKQQQKEETK